MPLIVLCGVPCSGKSKRTEELQQYFTEQGKEVHIVSENAKIAAAGFEKNAFYADSNKEKHIRGVLKSEVSKLITANNVVILDGSNYIKGYRYELFCATKSNKCTQCTVHTQINHEIAWGYNESRQVEAEKYTRDTFDALIMRFEEPDGKNRWDSPLFTILAEDELDYGEIFTSLFRKNPPKPNMSTQNAPLSSTNFLYDLDQITKKITDELVAAKVKGSEGMVELSGYNNLSVDLSNASVQQLMILRRQYITFSKMHAPETKSIAHLFVQYLTTSLK